EREGLAPKYGQRAFPAAEREGRLRVVVSPDGRDGSLIIHQQAVVFLSSLDAGESVTHGLDPGRYAWLQVMSGSVLVCDAIMGAGDGAALSDEPALTVLAKEPTEVIVFDLP